MSKNPRRPAVESGDNRKTEPNHSAGDELLKRMLEKAPQPHKPTPQIDSGAKKKKPAGGENTKKR
jgi:hypothetical protein